MLEQLENLAVEFFLETGKWGSKVFVSKSQKKELGKKQDKREWEYEISPIDKNVEIIVSEDGVLPRIEL